jgi:hypothetical protein
MARSRGGRRKPLFVVVVPSMRALTRCEDRWVRFLNKRSNLRVRCEGLPCTVKAHPRRSRSHAEGYRELDRVETLPGGESEDLPIGRRRRSRAAAMTTAVRSAPIGVVE